MGVDPAVTPCLLGAPLNPGRDSQLDLAQPPTSPSKDSALKLPLDKAGLPKPGTTPLAAFSQCAANKELVTPAEAPIILSSPRTSKTDSYDLVWRPRPDSRAPILYYVVKHRKVSLVFPVPMFPLCRSMGGLVASPHLAHPMSRCLGAGAPIAHRLHWLVGPPELQPQPVEVWWIQAVTGGLLSCPGRAQWQCLSA